MCVRSTLFRLRTDLAFVLVGCVMAAAILYGVLASITSIVERKKNGSIL